MKILIENNVATKLKYYTKLAPGEISGMGKTKVNEDGDIIFTDIMLFTQKCSGATTDIDDEALAKWMYELRTKGESLKDWNLWWHTHNDMAVFWSGTDDKCIKDHSHGNNYLISLVTNKAGDYLGRLDIFPKDNSQFKKKFSPVTYTLDVAYYIDKDVQKRTTIAINKLKKEEKTLKDRLNNIHKEIKMVKDDRFKDNAVEAVCTSEIKEKVRQPIIPNYRKKYNKQYSQRHFGKMMKHYRGWNTGQMEFEDILDDIQWGIGINKKKKGYKDSFDLDDDVPYCPECQNPLVMCECEDALKKYGHLINEDGSLLNNKEDRVDSYGRLLL